MALQERRGDLEVDLSFDGAAHDRRLVLAGREDRDLPCVEDRGDAHRDRLLRYVLLAEEVSRRIPPRHAHRGDETRPAVRAGAGLVEADVARLADAEELEVDPARVLDLAFVLLAVRLHLILRDVAPRDVDVLALDVHVVEQVLPHEAVVRWMLSGAIG